MMLQRMNWSAREPFDESLIFSLSKLSFCGFECMIGNFIGVYRKLNCACKMCCFFYFSLTEDTWFLVCYLCF